MNSLVWTTFALTVIVAPVVAIGVGMLFAPSPARRPVLAVAAPAVPTPAPAPAPAPAPEPLVFTPVPDVAPPAGPSILVEPRPGGRWAVRKDGATRAFRVFDQKQDAVDRAHALARQHGAELVLDGIV